MHNKMKKRTLWLVLSLLAPVLAIAQGWDEAMYKQIEQSIREPQFADKTYPITKSEGHPKGHRPVLEEGRWKGYCACRTEIPYGSHHAEEWCESRG